MSFATISGILKDSDATPWAFAAWSCVAASPSSPPVFNDGTPVAAIAGTLDADGDFSGNIPRTDSIVPVGTTLTFTIASLTSAPPIIIPNVVITTPTIDLGVLLSPRTPAPRIQSSPLAYAYSTIELLNPTHGDGFINTSDALAYIFVNGSWQPINSGPAGQIYPPSGIALSTGSAWAASINPASLTPYPGAGVAVSTGAAWSTPINPASLTPYPGAGVAVSTGAAWSTPINPADLPRLSLANIFALAQQMQYPIVKGFGAFGTPTDYPDNSAFLDYTPSTATARLWARSATAGYAAIELEGAPDNATGGGIVYLNCHAKAGNIPAADFNVNVNFNNNSGVNQGGIDTNGNATFNGRVAATSGVSVTGPSDVLAAAVNVGFESGGIGRIINVSAAGSTTPPDFAIVVLDGESTNYAEIWHYTVANDTSLFRPNVDISQNLTVHQDCSVVGTLTAGVKTFNIPHPLDATKRLIHACLEGPENGVYYRGQATTKDGQAQVELPDYFEMLTRGEGRTVQLTQVFDDGSKRFANLAASPIIDGKFTIFSSFPRAIVSWEVKAIRGDLPELVVVTECNDLDSRKN